MLFNSYIFLFCFLPITWVLFRFACKKRLTDVAIAVLTVASLVFYSYWNPPFVFLILFSILFNYSWGRLIERSMLQHSTAHIWLYIGVFVNLALIGYFKYSNFFMANLALIGGWSWNAKNIFLPLGISFFTFQQIAYLIDCYKGKAKEHTFTHYALFVTFFPQLIAGPIVRYEQIMPQFSRLRTFGLSYRNIAIGLSLLSLGLFKKVVIADTFSPWVAAVFDSSDKVTFFEAWAGALSYTFQIYFDFSGYSDMAIGLGKLFNIDIPLNFNSPYKSTSIIDFWRRWHITLSTFLRDYLYIPLGGSRKGQVRKYVNLMITMLLGGLWHGASWTFVVWGGLHGLFLCINHGFRKLCNKLNLKLPEILGWLITFPSVVCAWVFFRANTFLRAMEILQGMAGVNGVVLPEKYMPVVIVRNTLQDIGVLFIKNLDSWNIMGKKEIIIVFICLVISVSFPNGYRWSVNRLREPDLKLSILVGAMFYFSILAFSRATEFLYFQF